MAKMDFNGFTETGTVAGDYLALGIDPNIPRKRPEDIEAALRGVTPTSNDQSQERP